MWRTTGREGIGARALLDEWRLALTNGRADDSPKQAVLRELSRYFSVSEEEALERCEGWLRYSAAEWNTRERKSEHGLADFYETQSSWIFDTMWYHAQQADGERPPESVMIAERLAAEGVEPGRLLDFGAGPGSTALFFARLGWQVALADISATMLDFSRWRLSEHGVEARVLDLKTEDLPSMAYRVITACDVFVHVPDPAFECLLKPSKGIFGLSG